MLTPDILQAIAGFASRQQTFHGHERQGTGANNAYCEHVPLLLAHIAELSAPINGILHCPACGEQHIDAPETQPAKNGEPYTTWNNPSHKSHLCAHCGHIWRPFDVPTNGVQDTVTHGADDHQKPVHAKGLSISDMVTRFLGWKLPSNFTPDNGTNLFDADQARAMIEYGLDIRATVGENGDADFSYIERTYHRRFFKGQSVLALGKPGVVTGTQSAHVMVRLSDLEHANPYHPVDVQPVEELKP